MPAGDPAVKTEEEDGIYLEKTCPEHGDFRALIWGREQGEL